MPSMRFARTARVAIAVASFGTLALAQQPAPTVADNAKRLRETKVCNRCDLRGADFSGVDLYGAQMKEANLTGAVFYEANLTMANLTGAVGANLAGATTDKRTVCPSGAAGPCK
jgi:uncharacterized protein YjbI with pentapeptide repeats